MLYYDGVDSLGRPVVVVNADAVAAKVGAPDRVGSGQVGRPLGRGRERITPWPPRWRPARLCTPTPISPDPRAA